MLWHIISNLNEEEIVQRFYEKESKKKIRKSLELKNSSREEMINYMLNGKDKIIGLIAGYVKKHNISMWIFFFTRFFIRKCKIWIRFASLCNKNRFK